MEKFKTVGEMQAAYVKFCYDLYKDGLTGCTPANFVTVVHDDVDGRLDSYELAYMFLHEAGYGLEDIDDTLRFAWGAEYVVNRIAGLAMDDVDDIIRMYYDEAIDLEQAFEHLREALPKAKDARDEFFTAYPEGKIMH